MISPSGAGGAGHAALLIGDNEHGWYYYSKEGTYSSSGASGDTKAESPNGGKFDKYSSLEEWAAKNNMYHGEIRYTNAIYIDASTVQDAQMRQAASSAVSSSYNVVTCNCVDVVSAALDKAGFNSGGNNPIPNMRTAHILLDNAAAGAVDISYALLKATRIALNISIKSPVWSDALTTGDSWEENVDSVHHMYHGEDDDFMDVDFFSDF